MHLARSLDENAPEIQTQHFVDHNICRHMETAVIIMVF